jgi:hypothetical protein
MDLTKIDKPFGELDDATKGALLLAHLRGDVIEYKTGNIWKVPLYVAWAEVATYRVQPKPVIGDVVLHGVKQTFYSLHPAPCKTYDDEDDRLTFTFPTRDGMHVPGIYTSPDGLQIKIEVVE